MCEFVLAPKLKEGEFDLDEVEQTGVRMDDEVDDGSAILSDKQQDRKFANIVEKTRYVVKRRRRERSLAGGGGHGAC